MASNITKTIEMSRFFLKIFLQEGIEKIEFLLREYAKSQKEGLKNKDAKELNSRLMMVVSGIMSVIYGNKPELLIRKQLLVSENFINEEDINKKTEIFVKDLTAFFDEYHRERLNNKFSDNVIDFIRTCSIEELSLLTVSSLAEKFGYGKSRFLAKIKSETGKTAQEILSEERLERAYQLIKNEPQLTIKEISHMVGFTDTVYFSRLFKKKFKMLPSEVRNT